MPPRWSRFCTLGGRISSSDWRKSYLFSSPNEFRFTANATQAENIDNNVTSIHRDIVIYNEEIVIENVVFEKNHEDVMETRRITRYGYSAKPLIYITKKFSLTRGYSHWRSSMRTSDRWKTWTEFRHRHNRITNNRGLLCSSSFEGNVNAERF